MLLIIIVLGIIEGLTEFLPVSSTGHLVVASSLLGFDPALPWREPFLIVVQLGAILAVLVDRWRAIWAIAKSGRIVPFGIIVFLGFAPSALVGLAIHHYISELLKNPTGVALAFIVGGIAILVIDRPSATPAPAAAATDASADPLPQVTPKQALIVGCAQCLSLWPGMSRSASTILGGLLVGLDRKTATLFSFYVAIPTMFAASGYDLLKHRKDLGGAGAWFAIGMAVAFVVAWGTVRWMLRYVQTHTFRPFAVYRILAGAAIFFSPAAWWLAGK